jgi:glyoxylase-like metal-dependent hydrolase (beta-lactamase superfamily II)
MLSILPDRVELVFIASFPAGPWQTNCYLVAAATGSECVIIDPGLGAAQVVAEMIAEHRLKPIAVILTHGHLDHTFSVAPLCRSHAAACWVHPADRNLLTDPYAAMGAETAELVRRLAPGTSFVEPDEVRELSDGAEVSVAGVDFTALHAPGHTPGSTMFHTAYPPDAEIEAVVFSGDVLFAGSIGRTDLPGGDHTQMLESLRTKVLPLPNGAVVLPGHGPQTTIARERATNPYLRSLAAVGG